MEEITKPTQTVMIDPNEPLILPDGTALTGRIEWFLYSLCLLDYENLPTPMSRIEEFANALVTGEVPNIEPQSRVEEYFLAILTGDVENLPEPESRVEVLLNKLARGEFDLSDVEPIQSRYELLIAYLIKNSGIGDITYVLHEFLGSDTPYTMYNTKEKPTKSAILKGQTLVNISPFTNKIALSSSTISETKKVLQTLNQNTKYILIFNINNSTSSLTSNYIMVRGYNTDGAFKEYGRTIKNFGNGKHYILLESTEGNVERIFIGSDFSCEIDDTMLTIYQDGMENWDIPYFTGMQSVKMPVLRTVGKNLFDSTMSYGFISDSNGTINTNAKDWLCSDYVKLNKGTYTISSTEPFNGTKKIAIYDNNTTFVKTTTSTTFVLDNDGYVRVGVKLTGSGNILEEQISLAKLQIEVGTQATSFEQHKTNILTTTEEVVLRGIGDVRDTLDCLTGEVTERISEIVLDGSENWDVRTSPERYILTIPNISPSPKKSVISANFPSGTWNEVYNGLNAICVHSSLNQLIIRNDDISDIKSFKAWLTKNPLTVQYVITENPIKTVDLSILDQDGATVEKLNTFKDITHVSCSVDYGSIYPYVEMEVATSNDEDLAAIGLKLEEKNKVQSKLIKVNDYQSDVIDNVMLGITEIYESI